MQKVEKFVVRFLQGVFSKWLDLTQKHLLHLSISEFQNNRMTFLDIGLP